MIITKQNQALLLLNSTLTNFTVTKTGKMYLKKRIDHLKIPQKMIPNYVLVMFNEFSNNPVVFEATKKKGYFQKCVSLMRRYNLLERKKKKEKMTKDEWNNYMRNYRMKRKSQ